MKGSACRNPETEVTFHAFERPFKIRGRVPVKLLPIIRCALVYALHDAVSICMLSVEREAQLLERLFRCRPSRHSQAITGDEVAAGAHHYSLSARAAPARAQMRY